MPIITQNVIDLIKDKYKLNWTGIHGIYHWLSVWEIGMYLAKRNAANKRIV